MEPYIAQSLVLLELRPATARVTIRYSHKRVRHSKESTADGSTPAVMVFKTYDPESGTCFRYRVTKVQELARVLVALGPRALDVHERPLGGTTTTTTRKRGMASFMASVELPDEEAQAQAKASNEGAGDDKKKKKNKKKR